MKSVFSMASKVAQLPGIGFFQKGGNRAPSDADIEGYTASQMLTKQAVAEVASQMREGLTEIQAASLLNTCLRDLGVKSFFHQAFVWYGERTRFDGVKTYFDYLPTSRVVREGEVYILDVAPIVDGYICDIGFTSSVGVNAELDKAQVFLAELHRDIPRLFEHAATGGEIWSTLDERIKEAGYTNVHAQYPFAVLGHRVHRVRSQMALPAFINFGWQSYWEFLSRGLFGQLLNQNFSGDLTGLWAIEPHLGSATFGAKFEEILVFEDGKARWLEGPG